MVKHGVRAVSYSRSPGPAFIRKLKDAGVVCMPTVGAVKHAVKAVELGADAVTVQGGEGGGHTGSVPTTLLLPDVVCRVKVPVFGAGGFKDGRGLVAAMAFGVEGAGVARRVARDVGAEGDAVTEAAGDNDVLDVRGRAADFLERLEHAGPRAHGARIDQRNVVFKASYGPTISVYSFIGDDAERAASLDRELVELAARHDIGGGAMEWEYLLYTARRA